MKKYQQFCTDFLFARPSFLSGIARTLDICGRYDKYNVSATGDAADRIGLLYDHMMVYQDFEQAQSTLLQMHPEFVECLRLAIEKDPWLNRRVSKIGREEKKKLNECEMVAQGA